MTEISDPIRTVLQGYLEVLYLACDHDSHWTASDLHAAFEWALTLHKLASDPSKSGSLTSTAENIKPSLPCIIQDTLDEAIKFPTEVLLRRLLLHNSSTSGRLGRPRRPDWILKVLAAHTSACSLPDPSLANDVYNALMYIRQRDSCESLLQAVQKDTAVTVAVSPSAVQQLAAAAPSWVPFPATLASEYLAYFSKGSALELAAAATLLRQQKKHSRDSPATAPITGERNTEIAEHHAAHAELLAMALCIPEFSQVQHPPEGLVRQEERQADKEERGKRKLTQRLPQDPFSEKLCSLLRSTPTLAISLPAPLLARACRSSYSLSLEFAAALEKLLEENVVSSTQVIDVLKHACLFNDTTSLLFKEALDTAYRSI